MANRDRLDAIQLRLAMFAFLVDLCRDSPSGSLRSIDLNRFAFEDRTIPLVVQSGIWKPAGLDAALTIRTTFTRPSESPPYADSVGADGLVRYKYRGTDPEHSDNRSLRAAMLLKLPLAYFVGIGPGLYTPIYPVWVVGEQRDELEFSLSLEGARQRQEDRLAVAEEERRYALRLLQERVQQPVFRASVLKAYDCACAMCNLRHAELLDAAHIVPGRQSIVPNGFSLCKIHHAAFDANIVGVRPDLRLEVREDVLQETDGPMLRHGLQALDGIAVRVPRARLAQPNRELLETRYEQFRSSS